MSIEQIQTPAQPDIHQSRRATVKPSSVGLAANEANEANVADAPAPLPVWSSLYEAFALFLLFFSLAMLAWSGTFHSSDGLSMYAVSDSLARYGNWDTEQIRWMGIQQGNIGRDGLLFSRKGLATSVMALPLLWLGLKLPDIGPVHMALLLTPLIHALTALYLYQTVRLIMPTLNRHKALGIAVLWAFCSMAFAYVKTFFSEPAVALTMIGALYHLVRFRERGKLSDATAIGVWLGISALTRLANVIVFPFFGLALLAYAYQQQTRLVLLIQRRRPTTDWLTPLRTWQKWLFADWVRVRILAFALPIVAAGICYFWYNWLRFENPFFSGYIEGEEFSAIWWQGIFGLTISPGRGLLWYTPWLPVAFLGGYRLWKRDRVLTSVTAGSVLLYILVYSKWYLWSGGSSWGPRFLVPILPFFALLVAPMLERTHLRRAPLLGGWPTLVWFTGLLGFLINLIGVLWDFDLHHQAIAAAFADPFTFETFLKPRYGQIFGLLRLGVQTPSSIDLAWMVDGVIIWPILSAMLAIALAGVGASAWGWREQKRIEPLFAGSILLCIGLWLLLVNLRAHQAPLLQDALSHLPASLPADAQLWYDDPPAGEIMLNQVKEPVKITGFYVEGPDLPPEDALRTQQLAQGANAPIYLITDGPDKQANGLDFVLLEHLFAAGEQNNERYRASTYWNGPLSTPTRYDLPLAFPDGTTVILDNISVALDAANTRHLALLATWHTNQPLPENYQLFVHLYDQAGNLLLQQDQSPAQGRAPTTTWQPGQLITDRHLLRLPDELPAGTYFIHFGMYRLGDFARATAADGQNTIVIAVELQ